MLALFAVGFLLPFYFEELQGYSTLRSGLLLTPLPLTLAVVAPLSGSLADRVGSRWLAPLGLALASAGLLLLSGLAPASSVLLPHPVPGHYRNRAGALPSAQCARNHGSRSA